MCVYYIYIYIYILHIHTIGRANCNGKHESWSCPVLVSLLLSLLGILSTSRKCEPRLLRRMALPPVKSSRDGGSNQHHRSFFGACSRLLSPCDGFSAVQKRAPSADLLRRSTRRPQRWDLSAEEVRVHEVGEGVSVIQEKPQQVFGGWHLFGVLFQSLHEVDREPRLTA